MVFTESVQKMPLAWEAIKIRWSDALQDDRFLFDSEYGQKTFRNMFYFL